MCVSHTSAPLWPTSSHPHPHIPREDTLPLFPDPLKALCSSHPTSSEPSTLKPPGLCLALPLPQLPPHLWVGAAYVSGADPCCQRELELCLVLRGSLMRKQDLSVLC